MIFHVFAKVMNPLTLMGDQDRISPYNINTEDIMQTSDENKDNYQLRYHQLIQDQVLQTNITRIVWQTSKEN